MDKIKSILKYQKQIIEGLFISLIAAWSIVSVVRGATKKIGDVQFAAQSNFAVNIVLIALFGVLIGLVYYKKDFVARQWWHMCNPSTWEAEAGRFLSSRPAWSTE